MAKRIDWGKMNEDLDGVVNKAEKEIDAAYNKGCLNVEINRGSQFKLPRVYVTLGISEGFDFRTVYVDGVMKKYGLMRYDKSSFQKRPYSITHAYGFLHDNYAIRSQK